MKEQDFSEEVSRILQEAPSARLMLLQNYENLNNVAEYCSKNYLESGKDSAQALEETKNFTSQSLASVAYQISTLANSVLQLLDAQTNQLRRMESSVNLIGQTVDMHREKVCRREIGAFTVVKRVARGHKLLPPPHPVAMETNPRYSRQPIGYSHLDGLGHGMKAPGKQLTDSNHSNPGGSHGGTISRRSTNKPPEPVQCPVAPPTSSSSFGNPVAPPTAPTWPASPDSDIIKTLLDDVPPPPPPPAVEAEQNDDVTTDAPPPPPLLLPADSSVAPVAPPPPPPPPPPPQIVSNHSADDFVAPPPSPPLCLETVVEENSFPPPADDIIPPPANQEELDLPAPPPPPPLAAEEDLEIPAPPPPPLLDDVGGFDDLIMPLPPPMECDPNAPPPQMEKVVALWDYEGLKTDELSFQEGDVIMLTHRHGDGWCQGVVNGKEGFFPESYVQTDG